MPVLDNARHERFAQELAKGKTATEAYVLAGYKSHDGNAATLRGNQRVADRVAELQAIAAKAVALTVHDIARQLDEDRVFAQKQGSAAAAVSATMGKAKVLGLIIDKNEFSGVGGAPIEAHVTHTLDPESAAIIADLVK